MRRTNLDMRNHVPIPMPKDQTLLRSGLVLHAHPTGLLAEDLPGLDHMDDMDPPKTIG